MKNLLRKIEVLSNIAILVVAVLLGVVLTKQYLLPSTPKTAVNENPLKKGMKVSLPDIDWGQSNKNLVLAISTTCHFCSESVPFYQKIADQRAKHNDVRLIAVLPQASSEAERYLKDKNVSVDEIRQVRLSDLSVNGTPTLMIVDQQGAVVESWIGKLPLEKETEVLSEVFSK